MITVMGCALRVGVFLGMLESFFDLEEDSGFPGGELTGKDLFAGFLNQP